jgi:hypothetical protein
VAAALLFGVVFARPSAAVVTVTFGTSWDGPAHELQKIVDGLYGTGAINVHTDYIGAHVGDLDPWFWVGDHFPAMMITEVAGNANRNVLGWYIESGTDHPSPPPTLYNDNLHDGIVFDGPSGAGASTVISLPHAMTKFGFYMNPNGTGNATNAPEPEKFWTNRFYNDIGPDGSGALHPPTDGDVQALVFDLSNIVHQANTWLVCFEDLDTGPIPGPCCTGSDNDFNDLVFEVTALGATPIQSMTFGALKARYLH